MTLITKINTPSSYSEIKELLVKKFSWEEIKAVPDKALIEVKWADTEISFAFTISTFHLGNLIILKDDSDCYYTAWGELIPFQENWQDEGYTHFGRFKKFPNKLISH